MFPLEDVVYGAHGLFWRAMVKKTYEVLAKNGVVQLTEQYFFYPAVRSICTAEFRPHADVGYNYLTSH